MITKFKIYENESEPQIGDFVVIESTYSQKNLQKFMDTNPIGQIVKIVKNERLYYVHFDDIPKYIEHSILPEEPFRRKNILFYGTKEDCELFLQSNKYNL